MSEPRPGDRLDGKSPDEKAVDERPKRPSQPTFLAWAFSLRAQMRYKVVGVIALALAGSAIGLLEPAQWFSKGLDDLPAHLGGLGPQRAMLMFLQAAVCLALALATPKADLRWDSWIPEVRREVTEKACRRIKLNLVAVFLFWSVHYVVMGISLQNEPNGFDKAFITTLSSVTALLVFWLYLELSEITVDEQAFGRPRQQGASPAASEPLFSRFVSTGIVLLFVVPAWFGYGKGLPNLIKVADAGIGMLSGVALALVVGSLGSKYLNPGPGIIGLLYLYAMLQPAAIAFDNPAVQLFATTLALPLKIVLWLVCVWAFTTGVLAEHAYEVRRLIEKIDERRAPASQAG